jgi:formate transporter
MSYVKPDLVVDNMIQAGTVKAALSPRQLLMRGFLGGALLGFATTLAFQATAQTQVAMFGALLFPVGFVMIILLGMELVTGNFALIPLAVIERRATLQGMLKNWLWVYVGHIIGAALYALMFALIQTKFGHSTAADAVSTAIIKAAEAKTNGYSALGMAGMGTVFLKAILCNWMVCLGAVMAMTSQSTSGKILSMWLPILTFFGQGFEHLVVNLFVIPCGMMLGANVSFADWWLWNQIPVTLGNIVGGLVFTGLALYVTQRRREEPRAI